MFLNGVTRAMRRFEGNISINKLIIGSCRSSGPGDQHFNNINNEVVVSLHSDSADRLAEETTDQVAKIHEKQIPSGDPLEPPYIDELKPKVGFYKGLLNVELKGYDFVVLEKYQSYLHKKINRMGIKVSETWSVPHQELQFESLGFRSNAVTNVCKINVYERNIQIKDTLVTKLPILIDLIHLTLPPGVTFGILRHSEDLESRRYFRNSLLENLKTELQELKDTPLIGE